LILDTIDNKGYRASQFEAGVMAGKYYFAAYAQKIVASGSTFFDDAVSGYSLLMLQTKVLCLQLVFLATSPV
jgi:hypothetical protein